MHRGQSAGDERLSGEPGWQRVWVFPKCAEKPPKDFSEDRDMILLAFKRSLRAHLDSESLLSWVGNRPQEQDGRRSSGGRLFR